MDFIIRKDIYGNWWHDFNNNATKVSISDFECVIDEVANTFIIQNKNGSNVPSKAVSIADVKVIDQNISETPIAFSGAIGLKNLLTAKQYPPYRESSIVYDQKIIWRKGHAIVWNETQEFFNANFDSNGLGINLALGWGLCNGNGGRKDFRDRTVVSKGANFSTLYNTGGSANAVLIGHKHTFSGSAAGATGGGAMSTGNVDEGAGSFLMTNTGLSENGASVPDQSGEGKNMPPYIIAQWVERVSDLIVYYTGSEGGGAVDSVNGQTGVVIIPLDYLPLAGGTMDDGADIFFDNGSKLSEGLYDEGTFGNKGIARTCAVGYEDKWEAGEQYITETGSGIIQFRRFAFNVPTVDDDTSKRYAIGSYWQMRNSDIYICTDATEGAAVWEIYSVAGIPTLQEVLDNNHDLVNDNFFAGTSAGFDNSGINVNAFGNNSAAYNSSSNINALGSQAATSNTGENVNALGNSTAIANIGSDVNALGSNAGYNNYGSKVNAFGNQAAYVNLGDNVNALGNNSANSNIGSNVNFLGEGTGGGNNGTNVNALGSYAGGSNYGDNVNALGRNALDRNTGNDVNAFGNNAGGVANTFNNVNLFGESATADENGQTVLSKDGTIMARISTTELTDSRKYTLQDADGTLAFLSDITGGGTVTSVGLTMPSAFTVTNSPITSSGDIAVTGAGAVSQYVRGDGSLANFPTSSGGGSSLSFYLNGSVSQGTFGGVAFKEMDRTPILGAGTDFTINANGYIQSFITDAGVPNLLEIPAGNWNFETYFSASSGGGSPSFYVELYKWDGATLSLIASSSATPENITGGTSIDLYVSALAVPQTTLLATDRLAIRIYVTHSGRTITLHTENSHLCQVITTFSTGLTALNGLTAQVQNLAVGTTGTDFAINSNTATHTFNLPTASAANRGALSSADWTIFNNKQNNFILGRKASASSTLTGTTTETILESIFVPAGSVAVGDVIYIRNRVFKTGGLGGFSYRYRINSSNSISGSSVLGLVNLAVGSVRSQGSERTLNLRTGNVIEVIDNTTSYAYENSSPLNANTNITLTYTSDFWILITATLVNGADNIVNSNYIIQKF